MYIHYNTIYMGKFDNHHHIQKLSDYAISFSSHTMFMQSLKIILCRIFDSMQLHILGKEGRRQNCIYYIY